MIAHARPRRIVETKPRLTLKSLKQRIARWLQFRKRRPTIQFSLKRMMESVFIFGVLFGAYCAMIRWLHSGVIHATRPFEIMPMVFFHIILLFHLWPLPLGLAVGHFLEGMSRGGLRRGCIVSVAIWLVFYVVILSQILWFPLGELPDLGLPYD